MVENHGFVVAPLVVSPVNVNDTCLFPEALEGFMDFASLIGMDTEGTTVTLDAGFDSLANHDRLFFHELRPVIKPNRRRTTDEQKINERLDRFDEKTYKKRFCVERTFAWQDSYRRLSQRYEVLEETHTGFKYLAYALMNMKEYL